MELHADCRVKLFKLENFYKLYNNNGKIHADCRVKSCLIIISFMRRLFATAAENDQNLNFASEVVR